MLINVLVAALSGAMSAVLVQLLWNRPQKVLLVPGECECGHLRSSHTAGKGKCNIRMRTENQGMAKCACTVYIKNSKMADSPATVFRLRAEAAEAELTAAKTRIRELEDTLEYNNRIRHEAEEMADGYASEVKRLQARNRELSDPVADELERMYKS